MLIFEGLELGVEFFLFLERVGEVAEALHIVHVRDLVELLSDLQIIIAVIIERQVPFFPIVRVAQNAQNALLRVAYLYPVHVGGLNGRSEDHGDGHDDHQNKRDRHGGGYDLLTVLFAKGKGAFARIFYRRAYARHGDGGGAWLFLVRIAALGAKLVSRVMRRAAYGAPVDLDRLCAACGTEIAAENIAALGASDLLPACDCRLFRLLLRGVLFRALFLLFRFERLFRFECFFRLECFFFRGYLLIAALFEFRALRAAPAPRAKHPCELLSALGTNHDLLLTFCSAKRRIYISIFLSYFYHSIFTPTRQVLIKAKIKT